MVMVLAGFQLILRVRERKSRDVNKWKGYACISELNSLSVGTEGIDPAKSCMAPLILPHSPFTGAFIVVSN